MLYPELLTSEEYVFATLTRMGIPPRSDLPRRCGCGSLLTPGHQHHLHCTWGSGPTRAHDYLKLTLMHICQDLGALVTDLDVVNWATNDEDGKRLDLSVVMGDKLFLVDVARVNSAAPCYAASDGLAAVSKAAKAKIVHHQAALQKWNATPVPFVVNVHGGWGADAVDFAKRIVSLAVGLRPSLDYVDVMNDFVGRIAVAIQRGNYVAYLLNSQRVFNVAVPIAKLKRLSSIWTSSGRKVVVPSRFREY